VSVVAVIGAGATGLVTAGTLVERGHEVVVLEREQRVGGRLSTTQLGAARLDDAAQFIQVEDPEVAAVVEGWAERGLAYEWCRGPDPDSDGPPWFVGKGGMATLAEGLAASLDVRLGTEVTAVVSTGSGWRLEGPGDGIDADAVVVTSPLPEAAALVGADSAPDARYRRGLTVLAVLDRPSAFSEPGAATLEESPLRFVADNQLKGISDVPALTVHPGPEWTEDWYERSDDEIAAGALAEASEFIGAAAVVESRVRRWDICTPEEPAEQRLMMVSESPLLVLAGDGFGAHVKGAIRSGLAAAAAVG
jgi:renalase